MGTIQYRRLAGAASNDQAFIKSHVTKRACKANPMQVVAVAVASAG